MNATHHLVERYLKSWNETDPLRRRVLIEEVYAEHAVYTDPMVQARGWVPVVQSVEMALGRVSAWPRRATDGAAACG